MKEEIARIMKLVQDGKLSPEDAAELIDAFQGSKEEPAPADPQATADPNTPPPPPGATESEDKKTPVQGFVDMVEGIGRDISSNVNWKDISAQVRQGATKGFEALKKAAEEIKAGTMTIDFFGSSETRDVVLPLEVSEGKILKIENHCGSVKVTGGHESGSITARAKVKGTNPDDAKAKAAMYTLVIEESDHTVLVRQPRNVNYQVDMVVQLATKAMVEVRSDSGAVEIKDTGGGAKVASQSGDVLLRGIDGTIDVSIQSGNLEISDSKSGAASVESKSGQVQITNLDGNLNARCASGDFKVQGWTGKTFSVESVSGDVSVDLPNPVSGTVNIRTVNGDTNLGLADGGDARVSLSTLRGEVVCEIELQDDSRTEQRITGRLGEGSGTLDVSGINGDITVTLRDSV